MSGVELHEAVRTPVAARLAGPRRREAPRRLNVGCGDDLLPDYVNLDMAALPGVDVVHDL
ncbi:MAG: hypothetical protein HY723_06420, partial [Chloroflexi bacterium]|nr:hypothetical protein [Chloroflexota bacterium]